MLIRLTALLVVALACLGPAAAFGLDDVTEIARREAAQAYVVPVAHLPPALEALGYDSMRDVRYRPDHAVWRREGLPFELQFFHLGNGNVLPVQISEVAGNRVRPLAYDPTAWDFGQQRLDRSAWGDLGYAGFRVHHAFSPALNTALQPAPATPAYKDEVIVFLGASYFRALGRGQQYGVSARALAIDTVGGTGGEEFPRFKAFWIERPTAHATALTIHALLDSPRATGAYRFVVTPGETTTVDVQQRLFVRAGAVPPAQLGLAPLTSMFLHGENQPSRRDGGDFRPEIHDSDGLLVAAATEWLWRPLFNPPAPLVSSLIAAPLKGFGLLQRDRRPEAYEDTEAHYERCPSAWVEPVGDWGPGRVQLLQLPTPDETHDNIVACWVPDTLPPPGQPLALAWRLHWQGSQQTRPPNGWAVQARRGRGWAPLAPGEMQFMLDFDGPALRALAAHPDADAVRAVPPVNAVTAVATAGPGGRVVEARAWPHPQGGWRMQLRVQRADPNQPVELRAYLRRGDDALTETWAALVPPEPTP